MTKSGTISGVEQVKTTGRQLRGTIAETLSGGGAEPFSTGDDALLEFHGIYQGIGQDIEGGAGAGAGAGADGNPTRLLTVRVRVPAGRLTPGQYLALDDLAGRYANGVMRLTSRQSLQFYGVARAKLRPLITDIYQSLLTTLGAGGDVVRNIMANPVPFKDPVHTRIQEDARRLSKLFRPRTRAYREIWLDAPKLPFSTETEIEPVYGPTYLPQKFKIALATPDDNSVDVFAQDLGIIALFEDDRLLGYNFVMGGGMGHYIGKHGITVPRLAVPVCFIDPDDLLPAVAATVALFRDHGDRINRNHARFKVLIHEHGPTWAKTRLEESLGHPLAEPHSLPPMQVPDLIGWHAQGDGKWFLGVPVIGGLIADDEAHKLRTGLRVVIDKYWPTIVLTPNKDILLGDLPAGRKAAVDADLRRNGVRLADDLISLERSALACPSFPTCGHAVAEAERAAPVLIDAVAEAMAEFGLGRERLSLRISGCGNGCARPFLGDIGLIGRELGSYQLLVGGNGVGTRLNWPLLNMVRPEELTKVLLPLFALYAAERQPGERFGTFCDRVGPQRLRELAEAERLRELAETTETTTPV
ncbi:MAG: NADPH-dependent assimilatory sulfite reductase hemoprotein subunit [Rhodospirillaceae bacterium]